METAEVIDVSDTPQVTRLDPSTIKAPPTGVPTNDNIVEQPDPGSTFNSMRDKLDALMKEVTNKAVAPDKTTQPQPEPVKEEKKLDAKPEEKPAEVVPETFTSAKAADWKKLKEARAEAEKKASEFEKRLLEKEKALLEVENKFKSQDRTPEFQKQIDQIKSERDKLEAQLESVALERSERFQSTFTKAIDSAVASAKEAVGDANASLVAELMDLPPSKWRKEQLNKIRENLEGLDQGQFDIAIRENDKARAERADALKNAKENYAKLKGIEAETQNRAAELRKAQTQSTINRVLDMARAYDSFKPIDNDPEHNLTVRQNEERIGKFFNLELPADEMAVMPVVAAEGRRLMEKVVPSLQAKIKELEATVEAMKNSNPKPSGGAPGNPNTQPKTFAEAFQQHWPGQPQ